MLILGSPERCGSHNFKLLTVGMKIALVNSGQSALVAKPIVPAPNATSLHLCLSSSHQSRQRQHLQTPRTKIERDVLDSYNVRPLLARSKRSFETIIQSTTGDQPLCAHPNYAQIFGGTLPRPS